ncbi:hypothetical protein INS49_010727 [Diaporthe citri]|uniref:uncharacterized protein n=1 Tax=Diaporthe citri TaxID=83186 RepID=UPI001C821B3D|nr:uncharacterized protein INS49_010727 [Diaporthe citri]KAG6362495.1 hypothetical protein INS49_010727 [Diaporthe citri]
MNKTNVLRSNCTFPLVTSLGVCSSCENVTAQTQVTCNDTVLTAESQNGPYSSCNYTLPGGADIWAYAYYTSVYGVTTPDLNISLGSTTSGGNAGLDGTPGISSISIVRFDNDDENTDSEDPDRPTKWAETMTAYECKFELCAWSFEDWGMTNGILVNGTTAQSPVVSDGRVLTSDDFDAQGAKTSRVYTATDPDFHGNGTFEINPLDQQAMELTLSTIWYTGEASNGIPYFWNSAYLAGPNISQTLQNMATGITYNMMSGPSATLARGSLLETQTFVRTCAAHQRAWKSSLVPLLYADSTMVPGENGVRTWGEEDKVQRKAIISAGLLAASAAGTPTSVFVS